ncbi:hypothetical protein BDQ17DRAFT_1431726 [Cyathus striatus]|nr:hypothetical protein BDQ17DRAFT_1431726 [Cyathus striatus]
MGLITPLQHAPAVLSQLLLLATNYKIDHLASLVKHAMHNALSNETSNSVCVGVHDVATLCSCRSLQIRALRDIMKRSPRSKTNKDGSGGGGGGSGKPNDGPGGGGPRSGSGGPSTDHKYTSRPRGTSVAKWSTSGESGTTASTGYNTRIGRVVGSALEEVGDEPVGPAPEYKSRSVPQDNLPPLPNTEPHPPLAPASLKDIMAQFHISLVPISPPKRHHLPPILTNTHGRDTTPPLTSRSSVGSSSIPSTPHESFIGSQSAERDIRVFELGDDEGDEGVLPRDENAFSRKKKVDQYSLVADSFESVDRSTSSSFSSQGSTFSRFLGRTKKEGSDRSSSMIGADSIASADSSLSLEDDKKRIKEAKEKAKREKEKAAADARQRVLAARSAKRLANLDNPAFFGGVF